MDHSLLPNDVIAFQKAVTLDFGCGEICGSGLVGYAACYTDTDFPVSVILILLFCVLRRALRHIEK